MAQKILVSLVGKQTIANVQFIQEFEQEVDMFLFITTRQMDDPDQNRTDWIIDAIQPTENEIQKLIVSPNQLTKIEEQLKGFNFNGQDIYYLNLTGGNKLMVITIMNFFLEFKNVSLFYVSIDSNSYMKIYPKKERFVRNFKNNISLFDFLRAQGLKLSSREKLVHSSEKAEDLFNKLLSDKKVPEFENAHEFKSAGDRRYYSGAWFEEHIYYMIKKHFKLNNSEIAVGVKLKNRNTENEFDVLFVKDNTIYVVECKAYFAHKKTKQKIEKDLYKISALDDDFGLQAKSVYITTLDIKKNSEKESKTIIKRAKDLNVLFFQYADLFNNQFLYEM